jgi:endo-1,4-beta-xylanase
MKAPRLLSPVSGFLLLACAALRLGAADAAPSAAPTPGSVAIEPAHPAPLALWPGVAPGSEAKASEKEQATYRLYQGITYIGVTNVHAPTLTPYLPAKDKATGAAIIVAPGGGHTNLAIDTEGYYVAQWLADHGVAAFVLKYRLARQTGSTYAVEKESVADAQRALRLIRSRAAEWGINKDAVGVMGFSAGAEVVARTAMAKEDFDFLGTRDQIATESAKVNFQVLVYPGNARAYAAEAAPPTFMVAATDDPISATVAELYGRLRQANVPVEMHVFGSGAHGFGLGNFKSPLPHAWPSLLVSWLGERGFVTAKK